MMKKIATLLIKIFIILIFVQMINVPVAKAGYWSETINSANNFISDGKDGAKANSVVNDTKVKETTDQIYNVLLTLGIALSVIIGGILGIQIMWGSVEQQVKAKEMLMPYAAGCVVIFGAFGIWRLCLGIFSQL